jgi:hypothetical protein
MFWYFTKTADKIDFCVTSDNYEHQTYLTKYILGEFYEQLYVLASYILIQ